MNRFTICVTLCALLAISALLLKGTADNAALRQPVEKPTGTAETSRPQVHLDLTSMSRELRASEIRIRRALQTRVSPRFVDTPLDEAIRSLAAEAKLPIWLDLVGWQDEGLATDEPVNLRLKNLTVEQTFSLILEPLGLTWVIEDEVLKVTTDVSADEQLLTRIYNVRKLIAAQLRGESRKTGALETTGQPLFVQDIPAGGFPPEPGSGQWLTSTVHTFTSGPWEELEGSGSTSLVNDLLVVRQTRHVQDEVVGLLEALETFVDAKSKLKPLRVCAPHYPVAADAACHEALRQKLTVDFKDTPLFKVVDHVADQIEAQIFFDQVSLDEEGLAADEPITLTQKGLTVHSILQIVLEPLGCTFIVEDGLIKVTTQVKADETLFAMLFDVRDLTEAGYEETSLIEMIQSKTSGPWFEASTSVPIGSGLTGMLLVRQTQLNLSETAVLLDLLRKRVAGGDGLKKPATVLSEAELDRVMLRFYSVDEKEQAAGLEMALTAFVSPKSWKTAGGTGEIRIVGKTLAIRQTLRVHKEIKKFTEKLNEAETAAALGVPGGGQGVF